MVIAEDIRPFVLRIPAMALYFNQKYIYCISINFACSLPHQRSMVWNGMGGGFNAQAV